MSRETSSLPFSLKALLIAPWPVPLVLSALLALSGNGRQPVLLFCISLTIGLVIGYAGTAALAISLWFIGRTRPVTRTLSALLGVVLGGIGYTPFLYISWHASGPDSGPPTESFIGWLLHEWQDPYNWVFPACGLVTAFLYDALCRRFKHTPRPQLAAVA